MKKTIKDTSIIFLIIMATSCQNKINDYSLNIIKLEKTVGKYNIINLSEYATEIKYIPLETKKTSLISIIRHISYENDKILLASGTQVCYLFDNNGSFLGKIGQTGQGPGDHIYVLQSFIYCNNIYIIDMRKMLIYNNNGDFIKQYNFPTDEIPIDYTGHGWHRIFPIKNDTFIMNVASANGHYPNAIMFEIDQTNIKIIKEYQNNIKLNKKQIGFNTDEVGIMYRFKDDIRVYKAINDTIFTINKDTDIKNAFIFELGKYKPTITYYEWKENRGADKKYIIPKKILESQKHLFIDFRFGNYALDPIITTNSQGGTSTNTSVYSLFDKSTGELILMNQPEKGKLGFKNDIDNGPVIWPSYISSNNEIVACISAEDFLEHYEKMKTPTPRISEIAKKIKEDDNPILAIVKLK